MSSIIKIHTAYLLQRSRGKELDFGECRSHYVIKLPFIILLSGAFSLDGCLDKQAASSNRDVWVLYCVFIQIAVFRQYFGYNLEAGKKSDLFRLSLCPFMFTDFIVLLVVCMCGIDHVTVSCQLWRAVNATKLWPFLRVREMGEVSKSSEILF